MPDLDSQPPQPRAVAIWRWLLLLTPSVIGLAYPLFYQITQMMKADIPAVGNWLDVMGLSWALAAVLGFVLGYLLEKWRWGENTNLDRVLSNGFLIIVVNVVINFAGCAAIASYRP